MILVATLNLTQIIVPHYAQHILTHKRKDLLASHFKTNFGTLKYHQIKCMFADLQNTSKCALYDRNNIILALTRFYHFATFFFNYKVIVEPTTNRDDKRLTVKLMLLSWLPLF